MKRGLKSLAAAGILIWLAALPYANGANLDSGAAPVVWLVELKGPLGPAAADLISRSIEAAEIADAEAIIIRMDTPGGLDKSMRDLVQSILQARIPVITYVAPNGSRAASAGTYIMYASHIAAMAPATNIGSSTPVNLAPTPTLPGTDESEPAEPPPADAMMRKVINDAVAYLQGLAELRDRNIEWAEETVREGSNLRASEALTAGVIDLISPDLDQLLSEVDGWEVETESGTVKLATTGARVHVVESDWKHDLLEIITDPTIAYGLLIFGIYGLILELYNPGMIFPSVIGVVCLLLGAYGLQMLPVNYAGLALIVVGIGMMIAEVFTPTMGVLGIAGVVAFVMGSLMLMDTQAPGFSLPVSIIAAFALSTAAVMILMVGAAVRARSASVRTGREAMLGAIVQVSEAFEESGRVQAFGETWQARSSKPVAAGDHVEVVELDGLTLVVEPAGKN